MCDHILMQRRPTRAWGSSQQDFGKAIVELVAVPLRENLQVLPKSLEQSKIEVSSGELPKHARWEWDLGRKKASPFTQLFSFEHLCSVRASMLSIKPRCLIAHVGLTIGRRISSWYPSVFKVPLPMNYSSIEPSKLMPLQTMTEPPPKRFHKTTVGKSFFYFLQSFSATMQVQTKSGFVCEKNGSQSVDFNIYVKSVPSTRFCRDNMRHTASL